MTTLHVGDTAPQFTAPTDGNGHFSIPNTAGKNIILYFYPKDNTSGCTKEAIAFNENLPAFEAANTQIIGLSKDSVTKHDKFKEKYALTFPLVSDESTEVCQAYNTWVEKSMYGRQYMGIERSTFLIDHKGVIQKIWRKVKVKEHVEEVLKEAQSL